MTSARKSWHIPVEHDLCVTFGSSTRRILIRHTYKRVIKNAYAGIREEYKNKTTFLFGNAYRKNNTFFIWKSWKILVEFKILAQNNIYKRGKLVFPEKLIYDYNWKKNIYKPSFYRTVPKWSILSILCFIIIIVT